MPDHSKFPSRLRHIQKGDPLTAGIASSPDKVLEGRTNNLKDRLDAIEAGRALVWTDQVLAPDVLEGQPVYWNHENNRWELGLAAVEDCAETSTLTTLPSTDVKGMVLHKKVGNVGDIVLWGVVAYKGQLSNAIDGDITPGNYYLSGVTPGKMTNQRPPVTVLCCHVFGPLDNCDENAWVYVCPMQKDFLEDHIHFCFDLVARPAGVTSPPFPDPESHHVITEADSSLPGWLPADDPIFNGKAPTGAFFGYNFSAHEALDRNWPPVPVAAASLEMQRPEFKVAGRVHEDQVVIDKWGIWWMTDCWDTVPWPVDIDTRPTSSSSVSASSESASSVSSSSESERPLPCPQPIDMTLKLYFIKMTFLGQKTVVTSLEPDDGQPFRFVNCEGEVASTGSLFAQLILSLLIEDEFYGGQALKGITEANKFKRGWVTEGLIAGTNIQLTSTHQRRLNPLAAGSPSNPWVHQELVTVNADLDAGERELNPQIVALQDNLERSYRGIEYFGFPNGRTASMGLKFVIPPAGLPSVPKFKIRAQIFGLAAGTLTDFDVTYQILPRPTTGSPTPITDSPVVLAMNTAITVLANSIYEVESDEIDVEPGDTVYVTLTRDVDGSPTYTNEIGLHRFGGIITNGS